MKFQLLGVLQTAELQTATSKIHSLLVVLKLVSGTVFRLQKRPRQTNVARRTDGVFVSNQESNPEEHTGRKKQ